GIRSFHVTGVQTWALPISAGRGDLDEVAGRAADRQTRRLVEIARGRPDRDEPLAVRRPRELAIERRDPGQASRPAAARRDPPDEIGRASCRERAESPAASG